MKKVIIVAATIVTLAVGSVASAAGQMIAITSVMVSPDRHVTVTWNNPPGEEVELLMVEISTRPDRGSNGRFFEEYVVARDFPSDGSTGWTDSRSLDAPERVSYCGGKPCGPGTYYVSVTGWWGGYSSTDYENYGVVYSQVVPFTVNPICQQVLVKPGFYKKVVVKKGKWVVKSGKRVWVKPVYKKIWVKPVYKTECR